MQQRQRADEKRGLHPKLSALDWSLVATELTSRADVLDELISLKNPDLAFLPDVVSLFVEAFLSKDNEFGARARKLLSIYVSAASPAAQRALLVLTDPRYPPLHLPLDDGCEL